MGKRRWTDDQLREAVASARCLADVMRTLEIKQQRTIVVRAKELGLDIPVGKRTTWTDDEFRAAVAGARSVRGALKVLGVVGRGCNYKTFYRHAERLALDTSHFVGRGHLAGLARFNLRSRRLLPQILVENSEFENTNHLRRRLIREGVLEERCAECGLTEWRGQPVPLELHHVSGNRRDLRLVNLQLLCPNCHALTATHRGKNATPERRRLRTK
jgi:hypothetical protein